MLFKEKNNYYGNNSLQIIEEENLDKILKRNFVLDNIYFSLDGHNFFKRKDRYRHKIFLLICFGYFIFYNIFEIIENMVRLAEKRNPADYNNTRRISTLVINMINIIFILLLTTYTIVKLRIFSVTYY